MPNKNHYMSKDDGPIIKVALNDWTAKRSGGYIFRTEAEFRDQETNKSTPEVKAEAGDGVPTMDNTKAEITAWLEANDYEVDATETKAQLLDAIE